MKILVSYPWLELGGASNTSITLARGLKERGHEVFFFTKGGGEYEDQLHEAGIDVISAPYDPVLPHLYHLNPRAYRILADALDRHSIDIIHAYHPNSYFLSLFAGPRRNIPVVFTAVWLLLDPTPFPAYPGWVIFVAEEFRDHSAPLFGKYPREMLVLPNRLDMDRFRPGIDNSSFVEQMGLPSSGTKIAFMSRVDRGKMRSLKNALEAVNIMLSRGRDVTLAVAGDGSSFAELEQVANEINTRAGKRAVVLLGSILDTPRFLSWGDIVLGIGRCAFEGMACARPTLIVGENGYAGTVEPERVEKLQYYNFAGRNQTTPVGPDVLAGEIERIMDDRDLYERLSRFARERVLEHYDYREGAARLERLYERALNAPPLGRGPLVKLEWTNLVNGYLRRSWVALKLKLRGYEP
jgi:glycosyltransferase involved in cell wall biosynthesis